MPWEDPDVPQDADAAIAEALAGLTDEIDGFVPVEGDPLVVLAESIGPVAATTNATAVNALQLAIAGIGETVFGIASYQGAPAVLPDVMLSLALSNDDQGGAASVQQPVIIPAGFTIVADEVLFTVPTDVAQLVTFTLVTDAASPDEGRYTAQIHVSMQAVEVGSAGNVAAGTPVTVVTATGVVAGAAIAADGIEGADAETLQAYLDRMTDRLSTLRLGGVLAADLATLARSVPGVVRALGVDLWDPTIPSLVAPKTATIVPVDAAGLPVTPDVLAEVVALLESVREVNFVIRSHAPNYTPLEVVVSAAPEQGADPASVQAALVAAISSYLSPASWGSQADHPEQWAETTTVHYFGVVAAASRAEGVAALTGLTLNGASADVVLPGPAALPAPVDETAAAAVGVEPTVVTASIIETGD